MPRIRRMRRHCGYYRYNPLPVVRRRLIILTAVALEGQAIAGAWGLPGPKPGAPVRIEAAVLIEIHLVGVGASHLPPDLHSSAVSGIIMAGLAGALDPKLNVGDIVIDDCPVGLKTGFIHRAGKIHTSPKLVSTPGEKQRLHRETGALAVDMESEIIRAVAAEKELPFVSIRAISDSADETLDPAVLRMIDPFGRPRPLRIMMTLVGRPWLIPRLIRLGNASKLAGRNLAMAVKEIAEKWPALELTAGKMESME